MEELLNQIIPVIIVDIGVPILLAIFGTVAHKFNRYLSSKFNRSQIETAQDIIGALYKLAEKKYGPKTGQTKKEFVMENLKKCFPTVDETQLEGILEEFHEAWSNAQKDLNDNLNDSKD